jgi:hypothetical protein
MESKRPETADSAQAEARETRVTGIPNRKDRRALAVTERKIDKLDKQIAERILRGER